VEQGRVGVGRRSPGARAETRLDAGHKAEEGDDSLGKRPEGALAARGRGSTGQKGSAGWLRKVFCDEPTQCKVE
jgi:hypothetical protein